MARSNSYLSTRVCLSTVTKTTHHKISTSIFLSFTEYKVIYLYSITSFVISLIKLLYYIKCSNVIMFT
jgi:hypothetical protein